jgi:hydrogenase nickel incorporation protein HypB
MTANPHRHGFAHSLPTTPTDGLLDSLVDAALRCHRFGHDDDQTDDVLAAVEREAQAVHERLTHDNDVRAVEFLGATGSGKTALIEELVARSPPDERVGVVAGDVAGGDDAQRFRSLGVPAVDVTTGKDCHLDPQRVGDELGTLDLATLDTLFIENVGNMVCPADFPLGATRRVVVVSVTEGEDVVRKHPMLFQACDLAVVNKIDIADAVGVAPEAMVADLERIAPNCDTVLTSAETSEGLSTLDTRLRDSTHAHEH